MKIQKTFKKPGGRNLVRQKSKSKNKSGWQDSNLRTSRTAAVPAPKDFVDAIPGYATPRNKKANKYLLALVNFK